MTATPPHPAPATSPADVVRHDLDYICETLKSEFGTMAGRNLLIMGGAGFLGYYLVQSVVHWNLARPASQQIGLAVYDSFVRGVPKWLAQLRERFAFPLVQHDVRAPLPETAGDFHYIIHAASIASPTYYRKHPIETMDANIGGLRNLLEYARGQQQAGKPFAGFLFYSSSEIYGDPTPENIPTPETYRGNVSCTGPRACYDEAKRYGETLCVNFAREYGLPVKIARPFNNYGPGLKLTDRRVLPDLARDVFAGRDVVLLSDGAPKRTFCYVADAITGYYKVLVGGRAGEPYNVGVEAPEVSMADAAERVVKLARELFGYPGRVIRKASDDPDYLIDNPSRRCPVINKARTELGYNPVVGLDEGLRRLLVWYSGNREGEDA